MSCDTVLGMATETPATPGSPPPRTLLDVAATNIRTVATARGVKLSDLASAAHMSTAAMSKRWNGRQDITLSELALIAARLEVAPETLISAILVP